MPPDASTATAEKPKAKGTSEGADPKKKSGYSQTYLPDIHRTLPHASDAEQGVLCSMLISPDTVIGECVEQIGAGEDGEAHFHIPAHRIIYRILVELWRKQQPIDLITLTQDLSDRGLLDQVGGAAFVTNLFTFVSTAANVAFYLEIVREKCTLRRVIASCTECVGRAYNDQDQVQNLLDEVEQKIFAITQDRCNGKLPTMKEHVMDALESIEKIYERRGAISGLSTGFKELDTMTDGMHGAEIIVIAARPSMGKTALAMNIAEHVAVTLKQPVAVFSLEMSAHQLVQRLICSRARVSLKKVKDGFLADRDFPRLTNAASSLSGCSMIIDDTAGLSILELRAKARRLKSQHNIGLIVVDYLQLLRSNSRRAQERRDLEIGEISAGIKALSKELDIPIIVLAQLNRNPENRSGDSKGRPRLSDLRESGNIEQDADVVGLLVREEYYVDPEDKQEAQEAEGKATLIIAKQRNGPVGDVALTFLKEFTRFEDCARVADEG